MKAELFNIAARDNKEPVGIYQFKSLPRQGDWITSRNESANFSYYEVMKVVHDDSRDTDICAFIQVREIPTQEEHHFYESLMLASGEIRGKHKEKDRR